MIRYQIKRSLMSHHAVQNKSMGHPSIYGPSWTSYVRKNLDLKGISLNWTKLDIQRTSILVKKWIEPEKVRAEKHGKYQIPALYPWVYPNENRDGGWLPHSRTKIWCALKGLSCAPSVQITTCDFPNDYS